LLLFTCVALPHYAQADTYVHIFTANSILGLQYLLFEITAMLEFTNNSGNLTISLCRRILMSCKWYDILRCLVRSNSTTHFLMVVNTLSPQYADSLRICCQNAMKVCIKNTTSSSYTHCKTGCCR
jgi:hypothetical protein